MAKLSCINFQKAKIGNYSAHMYRSEHENGHEISYLLPEEMRQKNEYLHILDCKIDFLNESKKKSGVGKRPKFENSLWEAIINIDAHHTIDDVKKCAYEVAKLLNYHVCDIAIHRDEGHIVERINKDTGEKKEIPIINLHAHVVFQTFCDGQQNCRKEHSYKKFHDELQDVVAKSLNMKRGELKEITGKKHMNPAEYRRFAKLIEENQQLKDENEFLRNNVKYKQFQQLTAEKKNHKNIVTSYYINDNDFAKYRDNYIDVLQRDNVDYFAKYLNNEQLNVHQLIDNYDNLRKKLSAAEAALKDKKDFDFKKLNDELNLALQQSKEYNDLAKVLKNQKNSLEEKVVKLENVKKYHENQIIKLNKALMKAKTLSKRFQKIYDKCDRKHKDMLANTLSESYNITNDFNKSLLSQNQNGVIRYDRNAFKYENRFACKKYAKSNYRGAKSCEYVSVRDMSAERMAQNRSESRQINVGMPVQKIDDNLVAGREWHRDQQQSLRLHSERASVNESNNASKIKIYYDLKLQAIRYVDKAGNDQKLPDNSIINVVIDDQKNRSDYIYINGEVYTTDLSDHMSARSFIAEIDQDDIVLKGIASLNESKKAIVKR